MTAGGEFLKQEVRAPRHLTATWGLRFVVPLSRFPLSQSLTFPLFVPHSLTPLFPGYLALSKVEGLAAGACITSAIAFTTSGLNSKMGSRPVGVVRINTCWS